MTVTGRARGLRSPALAAVLVVAGLAAATALRVAVGGVRPAASAPAGAAFAVGLVVVAVAARWRPSRPRARDVATGVAGAAVLCLVPAAIRLAGHGIGPFSVMPPPGWAGAVVLVAVAEEVALRGVLHDAVASAAGDVSAVAAGAVLFGLLHVVLYGWGALPLDTAVGAWLGALRLATGAVAAPATAHAMADLAAWWLR